MSMRMLHFVIETVAFLLSTCFAAPKCPNGTIEEENATVILECVNQARRKLASGLQTTTNGIYLPPPKSLNDLQWDCEIENLMAEMVSVRCFGQPYNESLFWFSHNTVLEGVSFLDYLSNQLARIEDEAPKNITDEAVVYNDIDPEFGPAGGGYYLFVYLHLMSPRAQKFACIIVGDICPNWPGEMYVCGTEQIYFKNGDIVYEIGKATSTTTTAKATTYTIRTAKATTSTVETAKATNSIVTTSTILNPVTPSITASSTGSTAGSTITQCARPSTTSPCIMDPPRRVKRVAKVALPKSFRMKSAALGKRKGKTHRKQLRNTESSTTLSAHRMHAATATAEN